MQIYLNKDVVVARIQRAFQAAYPHLQLEFYWPIREYGHVSATARRVPGGFTIDEIQLTDAAGWIDIGHNRTALELESDLKYMFGLVAHVAPRSGDQWLETIRTDSFSLAQLNAATINANYFL